MLVSAIDSQARRLSALIGDIYDCAIMPSQWRETLRKIVEFTESETVVVNILSPATRQDPYQLLLDYGMPEAAKKAFFEKYIGMNPMAYAMRLYDVDEAVTRREALGVEAIENSAIYREWAVPFGMLELMVGVIRKDAVRVCTMNLTRRTPYEEFDKFRMKLLLPHLRRAVTIAQMIDDATVQRDRFEEVVERLKSAVLIVDSDARVRYANRAGENLLARQGGLNMIDGVLTCANVDEQAALLAALAPGGHEAPTLPVTTAAGDVLAISLLPLEAGYRLQAVGMGGACTAIFVEAPAAHFEWPGEMVGKLFKLTGAELQLLFALLDGDSLANATRRLGVAMPTIKTHLQRIFAKTGTSRQADLLRKVAVMMPPAQR